MITIKNEQNLVVLDLEQIKARVQKMIESVGCGDFDIGILFTTNDGIQAFNKKYRQKDKPTDILSFPAAVHRGEVDGAQANIFESEEKDLGDIVISVEFAQKDATPQNRSLQDHLDILLAHGIAHLLGYDHQTDEAYQEMQGKERELLESLE